MSTHVEGNGPQVKWTIVLNERNIQLGIPEWDSIPFYDGSIGLGLL